VDRGPSHLAAITMTTKPEIDYRSDTWEAAAQEAAFADLCFCMLSDGRFINRHAMPDTIAHRSPFVLPDAFLTVLLEKACT
jgi:hypothetical protein